MTLLIIGLILWIVSHTLKRLAPGLRASLGEKSGKGLVALMALTGIVLMVIGYRAAPVTPVYMPLPGMGHLNNLLMLFAAYFLMVGAHKPGWVATHVRHNMLTAALIWAVAHLLVNGDLASIMLFGSLGAWALVEMFLISRAVPWQRPERGPLKNDLIPIASALVLYAVAVGVHLWLGHNPFLGTYT